MKGLQDVGRAGLVCAVIAGGMAVVGSQVGGEDSEHVRARFESAAPLVEGNQVKVDGVVVGTVEALEVADGVAEVSLELDDPALPLHDDARLTIRPVSLLGERYVDLDRGSPKAPVLDAGTVIPVGQTDTAVGLDEVLNTVDDPTGESLRGLVLTLGQAMQDNGGNAKKALEKLAPSLEDTGQLAAVLNDQNQLLSRLVDNFEPVAGALATRDGKAMDKLVDSSERVLTAVRQRQEQLEETLGRLPGTLAALRKTLGRLQATADATAPTLAQLRPLTDKLPQLSGELREFSDALDPALATSQPVLDRAEELLEQAAPVASTLRTSAPELARTTRGLGKVTRELTQNRENLFKWIRYWALTTNGRDGLSHYFRVNATLSPATLTGLLGTPLAPTQAAPKETADDGGQVPEGDSSSGGGAPLAGLLGSDGDGLLGGGLLGGSKDSKKDDSPTGLNEKQESGLLGMLLGGQ